MCSTPTAAVDPSRAATARLEIAWLPHVAEVRSAMIITGTHGADPRLDAYRCVGDHAALERAGLFVAEGRLIVERLLEDGRFRMHSVAVTPPAAAALDEIFQRRPDVSVYVCAPEVLHAITGFEFHRGCLALAWR